MLPPDNAFVRRMGTSCLPLVVVGLLGSGKTRVAKYIAEVSGLPYLESSSYLKKFAKSGFRAMLNKEKDKHEKEDPDWLWREIKKDVDKYEGHCVISGPREPYWLAKLVEAYPDTMIVKTEAPEFIRYSRVLQRDGVAILTDRWREMNEGDRRLGIDIVLSGAAATLSTCGSWEDTVREIEAIMSALGIPGQWYTKK